MANKSDQAGAERRETANETGSSEESLVDLDSIEEQVRDFCEEGAVDRGVEVLREAAWRCIEEGAYDRALTVLERLLKLRPDDIQTRIEIAKTHLRSGEADEAFEQLVSTFDFALDNHRHEVCDELLGLMERIRPEGPTLQFKRGELAEARGESEAAVRAYRGAVEQFEDAGQQQEFLEVGKKLLELNPELDELRDKVAQTLIVEARAFVELGLFRKAIRMICEALNFRPDRIEYYEKLIRVLTRADRDREAIEIAVTAAGRFDAVSRRQRLLGLALESGADEAQIEMMANHMGIDVGDGVLEGAAVTSDEGDSDSMWGEETATDQESLEDSSDDRGQGELEEPDESGPTDQPDRRRSQETVQISAGEVSEALSQNYNSAQTPSEGASDGDSGQLPVIESESAGLASEEATEPRDASIDEISEWELQEVSEATPEPESASGSSIPQEVSEASDLAARRQKAGLLVEASDVMANVSTLLEHIYDIDEPTRVTLSSVRGEGEDIEMITSRGRLFPGVRVGDEYVAARAGDGSVAEVTTLDSIWDGEARGEESSPAGITTNGTRQALRRQTVRSLEWIGRRAVEVPLTGRDVELEGQPRSPVSFSASSMLMGLGSRLADGVGSKDRGIEGSDELRELGDEQWFLRRLDDGQLVPVEYRGRRKRAQFHQIINLVERAKLLAGCMEALNDTGEEMTGWNVLFGDTAWGVLFDGETMCLVRAGDRQLGVLTRRWKQWLSKGEA